MRPNFAILHRVRKRGRRKPSEQSAREPDEKSGEQEVDKMKISARNQLKGTIANVAEGAVNGVVTITLGNDTIKADITMESIDELELTEGKTACAIIKATNVMFASGSERIANISARNQLAGTICAVKKGAVNGHVSVKLPDGNVVTGSITNAAIEDLGLAEGQPALAIIKATDVIVGVE